MKNRMFIKGGPLLPHFLIIQTIVTSNYWLGIDFSGLCETPIEGESILSI